MDKYRIPVALEIIGVSKKLDLGRGLYYLSIDIELENDLMEITLELNNNNIIIVYKNNEYFPNGSYKFDLK